MKLSRTKNICLGFEGKLKLLLQTLKVTCKKEQLFICSSSGEVDLLTFSDDWKNLSHQVFFFSSLAFTESDTRNPARRALLQRAFPSVPLGNGGKKVLSQQQIFSCVITSILHLL